MSCERVQRELTPYLHGTLSPQERAAIEAHLSSCEACAEEATAMKEMGDLLSKGLKEWVDNGVCPADLAERIELSLRSARQRPWWQRWPAVLGAAATVAAIFIVVLATQPHLAQEMASVPLIGALAAQLINPDVEVNVDPNQQVTAALFRPTRTVDLAVATDSEGATLTVERVASDSKLLRVQYTIKGAGLVLPAEKMMLVPKLESSAAAVPFHSLTADRKGDEIRFVAYFDVVPAGEKLSLTVPALSTEAGTKKGPWTVSFTN
jgi:hypothetical protein